MAARDCAKACCPRVIKPFLSVFGGLIVGAVAGVVLLRRWNISARPFIDAIAPAMMLGYAIALLWAIRKHPFRPGWLFSVYLVLAGIERLLIEQIRVNVKFEIYGIPFTQAELIAAIFLGVGMVGLAMLSRPALSHFSTKNGVSPATRRRSCDDR
jgi:prolipoprotein diacylglyceryltransferase